MTASVSGRSGLVDRGMMSEGHLSNPMDHVCHAEGCETRVPPRLLMCPMHWRMVPHQVQRRVWAAYVPGQEVRKDPTRAYMAAHHLAIAAVAAREGRTEAARRNVEASKLYERG